MSVRRASDPMTTRGCWRGSILHTCPADESTRTFVLVPKRQPSHLAPPDDRRSGSEKFIEAIEPLRHPLLHAA